VVLGLASSGVHSNGFSLVRKVLEVNGLSLHDAAPWDPSTKAGLSLLEPTIIYVKRVLELHDKVRPRLL
jgi:phosphoribosylaminoimidazole (AIR) synthetase